MLIQLLILLLIAGVCGALGQAITGYSHGGCLVSIALGFIRRAFWIVDRGSTSLCRAVPRLMWRACIFRSCGPSSAQRCSWR